MDRREAAERWARTWATAWPVKNVEAIVALQARDGDHYASMFRRYRGPDGLRQYVTESFAEESGPAEVWFASPRVDGDSAAVEYWAIMQINDEPVTLSGCTVVRFDDTGLVAEARDYSHSTPGRQMPPAGMFS